MKHGTKLDRSEFEYVFIHANSLAELALRRMAGTLEQDSAADADKPPPLSEDDRDAQAMALLSRMDLSAMTKDWEDGSQDAEVLRVFDEVQAAPGEAAQPVDHAHEKTAAAGELAGYLERAYAARSQIAEHVDAGMARLDHRKLAELLSALPSDLPSLTRELSASDFERWLAVYEAGDDALNAAVVLVRGLGEES